MKKFALFLLAGLFTISFNSCEKDVPQLDNFEEELFAIGGGGAKGCPDITCIGSEFREERDPTLTSAGASFDIRSGKIYGIRWGYDIRPQGWSIFDTGVEITILRLNSEGKVDQTWRPTTLSVDDIKLEEVYNIDAVATFCNTFANRFTKGGTYVPDAATKAIWRQAVLEGANGFRVRYRIQFQNPETCETPAGPRFNPRAFLPINGREFL